MHFWIALISVTWLGLSAPAAAFAQHFRFERTIAVDGSTKLDISTVRGAIRVTGGDPGLIVIRGHVTARFPWNVFAGGVATARQVAAAPPITQEGRTISLGTRSNPAEERPIIVEYDVRVPPDTVVIAESDSGAITVHRVSGTVDIRTHSSAIDVMEIDGSVSVRTGSGAVVVDGVAGALSVTTGSSAFRGRAVEGPLRVRTRTGAIDAVLSGDGDADVETDSSAVRISGIRGGLTAATQSGRLSFDGVPRRDWVVATTSGNVDVLIDAPLPLTVNARTGSGSVRVTAPEVQGSISKRQVIGAIAGGGALVKVASRSGSIAIEQVGQ